MKHEYKVRQEAGMTQHTITVNAPTYDEATETQRRAGYKAGVFGQGITVPSQNTLRTAIKNGKRGDALNAVAQSYFDTVLAGKQYKQEPVTIDAKALKLSAEQVAGLRATGAIVVNDEYLEDEADDDEAADEATDDETTE